MKFSVICQIMKQMGGIISLQNKYNGHLPDITNYVSEVKYSLPFHGTWTVVNGGVTEEYSHSWEVPTQRYAYDFIMLDQAGKSAQSDDTNPESFYCYGKEIISPADGVVIKVVTGNPDTKITKNRKASCGGNDLCGNHVIIQHADQKYSLLAHLKPDSIIVSVGQKVLRGEKIALCGNSGNTSEPHLHFHIQAGESFYSSPGLPIEFEKISVVTTPNYQRYDEREPFVGETTMYPPYITRGQKVSNNDYNYKYNDKH